MGWEVLFKRLECWAQDKCLTSWIVTWSGSSLKSLNLNTLTFLWEHRQTSGTDHKGWIQVPLIHYCFACHSWRLLQIQRWNQRDTSWSFRAGCWHENPFADIHWNYICSQYLSRSFNESHLTTTGHQHYNHRPHFICQNILSTNLEDGWHDCFPLKAVNDWMV